MGKGGGLRCLLFVLNLLFFVAGVAVIGVGGVMCSREGPYATLIPSLPFLTITVLTLAVGSVVILVSFLGCCGAATDSGCMLCTYFIILLLLLTGEVATLALGLANAGQVEAFIEEDLTTKGLPLYGTAGQDGLTSAWDRLQQTLNCCGINNATDWSEAHPEMTEPGWTPDSCCVEFSDGCGKDPGFAKWDVGCKDALMTAIRDNIGVVVGVMVGVLVLQVFGMMSSCALACLRD